MNPTISIKTLITKIKKFMNYTLSYKMTWLASVGDDYGKESYVKLPKVLGALQCCVPGIMIVAQTKSVFEEREIVT